MDSTVLSYAGPRPPERPPDNPVTPIGLWVGAIGWGCAAMTLLSTWFAGQANAAGFLAQSASALAEVLTAAAAVLAPSGVLLATTAVVVGPARRRAAGWLAIQMAAHGSVLLAMTQL